MSGIIERICAMVCYKCAYLESQYIKQYCGCRAFWPALCGVASGIQEQCACWVDRFWQHGCDPGPMRKDNFAVKGVLGGCWLCRSQACTSAAAWIFAGIVCKETTEEGFSARVSNCSPSHGGCHECTTAKQQQLGCQLTLWLGPKSLFRR